MRRPGRGRKYTFFIFISIKETINRAMMPSGLYFSDQGTLRDLICDVKRVNRSIVCLYIIKKVRGLQSFICFNSKCS